MRYQGEIIKLVDIIDKKSLIAIQAEKAGFLTGLIHEDYLSLLVTAEKFHRNYSLLPDQWRDSPACFQMLAEFFDANEDSEENASKAAVCWYLLLENHLPSECNPNDIAYLAERFIAEPYQFAGFILWAVNRMRSKDKITFGYLFQEFFQYHIARGPDSFFPKFYNDLKMLSKEVEKRLESLVSLHCGMREFFIEKRVDINNKLFETYNIFGSKITYLLSINEQLKTRVVKPEVLTLDLLKIIAEEPMVFYQLFEIDLIRKIWYLDVNKFGYSDGGVRSADIKIITDLIFSGILGSQSRDNFLLRIQELCLSGAEYFRVINYVLSKLNDLMPLNFSGELIKKFPFYLHLSKCEACVSVNVFHAAVNQLISNKKFHTVSHLPALFLLSYRYLFSDRLLYKNKSKFLLGLIFKIFIDSDNFFGDDLVYNFHLVSKNIRPFFLLFLSQYQSALLSCVRNSCADLANFTQAKNIWSEQKCKVALIDRLFEDDVVLPLYPRSMDSLKAYLIETCYENSKRVPYHSWLVSLDEDQLGLPKFIQRILHKINNSACIMDFLSYIFDTFSQKECADLFFTVDNNDDNLFDLILEKEFISVNQFIFSKLIISDQVICSAIFHAMNASAKRTNFLFSTLTAAQILRVVDEINLSEHISLHYHLILKKFLLNLNPDAVSLALVEKIYQHLILKSVNAPLYFDCPVICAMNQILMILKNHSSFSFYLEKIALLFLASQFRAGLHWLCGMPTSFSSPHEFEKNNVSLYLKSLTHYCASNPRQDYYHFLETEFNHFYENNDTLLHLLARQGDFFAIKDAIIFFHQHLSAAHVYHVLNSENDYENVPSAPVTNPDAARINAFLTHYKTWLRKHTSIDFSDGRPRGQAFVMPMRQHRERGPAFFYLPEVGEIQDRVRKRHRVEVNVPR